MHPALSVIFFTVTSGAGYGLMFAFALLSLTGVLPGHRWFGSTTMFIALGFASIGLLSSTFHLGHPERAWRALSQWRSSWLSREGVVAIVTYVPAGLLFLSLLADIDIGAASIVLALLSAIGAVVVVSCTGMIYASLRPIRQWHHPLVLPLYHAFALQTGVLLLIALCALFGTFVSVLWGLGLASTAGAWALKTYYWRRIENEASASTPQTATGLKGDVRLLDPPHTEENYLLKEMGYRVARKHGEKLRRLAVVFGAVLPFLALAASWALGGAAGAGFAALAALSAILGAGIERWLFFGQAQHTVTLYYGASAV